MARSLFIYFRKRGYDIKFCETSSSSDFRKSIFGKKKHDRLDCLALAKYRIVNEYKTLTGERVLNNLSFDNYDPYYSGLRDLLLAYKRKSKELVRIKNKVKILVDLRFPEAISIFRHDRACKIIIRVLCHSKKDILSGKLKLSKQDIIQKYLKRSIGQFDLKVKEFNALVEEQNALVEGKKTLQDKIESELEKKSYGRLFAYCGLNSINIATLVSDVQDIEKFFRYNQDGSFNKKRSLRAFKNFLGITVTSNQSGEKEGAHKLVKSGCKTSRDVLMMLALTYLSMKNVKGYCMGSGYNELNPAKYNKLYEEYCKRTKKMIAVTKIMNKIATDLFFVLKDMTKKIGTSYE